MAEVEEKEASKEVKKASAKMISEVGQPGVMTSNTFVKELGKKELEVPNIYFTFDQMVQDSAVAEPLTLTKCIETNSLSDGLYESSGTRLSEALAEYGNYIIHNMPYMSWHEAVQNINTHIKYGYSINEIVAERAKSGKYAGDLVLKHLGPRSPKSVYAWVWDDYKRRVTHVIQKPLEVSRLKVRSNTASYLSEGLFGTQALVDFRRKNINKYPVLNTNKLLHNIYDGSMSNPQGNSPLIAAYQPWQEKNVVGEYEVIGVARNFGGVPVARVPDQLLIDANNPDCPEYLDAKASLNEIQNDLESAHAGRQAFFLLPSSLVEGSNNTYEWDLKLLGIEGGNGNFDVTDIINRKVTDIYRAFNATHLNLGQAGNTSSYSLAESGTNSHAHIINRDLRATATTIERMLGSMLDAQGFEYDKRDLPKFRWKTPDQLSLDEVGKFIQRTKSVDGMTPQMMETILHWANIPTDGIDSIDFTSSGSSRAGESQGSSGTGNSQSGGSNSSTNMENKQQHYRSESLGDDQTAILDENDKLVTIIENDS